MSRGLSRVSSGTGSMVDAGRWMSSAAGCLAVGVSCASAARSARLRFLRAHILHPSVYALMSPPQPLQIFRGPGIPLGSPILIQ